MHGSYVSYQFKSLSIQLEDKKKEIYTSAWVVQCVVIIQGFRCILLLFKEVQKLSGGVTKGVGNKERHSESRMRWKRKKA
jgi:hypothetical protein